MRNRDEEHGTAGELRDLWAYEGIFEPVALIFALTKAFPTDEHDALTASSSLPALDLHQPGHGLAQAPLAGVIGQRTRRYRRERGRDPGVSGS